MMPDMSQFRLTRRDLFYGVLIVGIAIAAIVRSKAERDRTDAAERQSQQVIETYKEQERQEVEASSRMHQQRLRDHQELVDLRRENNELRARLGEPARP
jgi:ribulose kinase